MGAVELNGVEPERFGTGEAVGAGRHATQSLAQELQDRLGSGQTGEGNPGLHQGLRSAATREFAHGEPIDLTALVELDADGTPSSYFIGPRNGGLEIKHRRKEFMVITPQSPLGQTLMGRKAGQRWAAQLGGSTVKYHIVSVS